MKNRTIRRFLACAALLAISAPPSRAQTSNEAARDPNPTRSWFVSRLTWHRFAQSRDRKIIVAATVLTKGPAPMSAEFVVNTRGELRQSIGGPYRKNEGEKRHLSPAQLNKLNSLLSRLPPSESLKPGSRIILSFFNHGDWTTRIYDGVASRPLLKAILETGDETNQLFEQR